MKSQPRKKKGSLSLILRDQIWQFVSTVIGALAILAMYHAFLLQQETKALQVVILANASLVEVEQSVSDEIKVFYKDQTIENLSLFQVKLENSGSQPIREEDYARPIKFVFPPQAEVIDAEILESNPPNIGMAVQKEQNVATLSPVLLNEEDQVVVRFLVSNMLPELDAQPFDIDARVAGVKVIDVVSVIGKRESGQEISTALGWILGGLAGMGLGSSITGFLGFALQQLRFLRKKGAPARVFDSIVGGGVLVSWALILIGGLLGFLWLALELSL